jgi:hypothetical protein
MFHNGGFSTFMATPPIRGYQQWANVDHAPIQYRVGWGEPDDHRRRPSDIDFARGLVPQNVLIVA